MTDEKQETTAEMVTRISGDETTDADIEDALTGALEDVKTQRAELQARVTELEAMVAVQREINGRLLAELAPYRLEAYFGIDKAKDDLYYGAEGEQTDG